MPALPSVWRTERVLRTTLRGDQSHSQAILHGGGGAMSDTRHFPDEPPRDLPPEWQQAVRIALRLLARRYPTPISDRHEWQRDCIQEAYTAIAAAAPRYACPNPTPADPARHHILWLATHAYNALRRLWRQEVQYYAHTVPMVVEEETGEVEEVEFEDAVAGAMMLAVLERMFCVQVLEQLSPCLDATDWGVLQGLAEGKTQSEVAQELGLSQSSVSERLGRIRRRARLILPDLGVESR
ncbi:MAG: hypothetical protein KatS3mg019_1704 [Fimbriimonadales bacterium]|nr:MAG: hypothetical protein KatS3mg019_1704 [Fimbriimonadales bacterium]